MPERDTFTHAEYWGREQKSLDELVAPVAVPTLIMVCAMLLVALNRDARRLWAVLAMVALVVSVAVSVIAVWGILFVWRHR